MVLTRRDDRYEALDRRRARSRSAAPSAGDFVEVVEPRAATRSPTSRPTSSRRSPPSWPTRTRTGRDNAYPHAYDQIAQLFDSPGRPRPLRDPLGRPQLGGPGRPPRRARLARRRAGPRAVRDRRQGRARRSGVVPRAARLVDVAPTIAALLGCAPRADGRYLAVQDGVVRDRRARPGSRAPAATSSASSSTAPTPNVLYDMAARGEAPNVARLIDDGHRVRARRDGVAADGHAREPHVDHHRRAPRSPRHPPQRVVRPRDAASRSSPTRPRRGRRRWSTSPPGIESIHDAVHRTWPDAFTASVNEPCDIGADYSTFDFFRRGEVPPIPKRPVRPAAHDRAIRAPVEGLLVVVGRRPHGHRPGARHPLAVTTATSTYPLPALHVVQLHAHRRRDARRRPVLGDGGRVGPRQRRPPRRGARRARAARRRSTTPRSCSSPTTAWRRTTRRARGDWDVALRAAGLDVPRRGLRLPVLRRLIAAVDATRVDRRVLVARHRHRRLAACSGDDDDRPSGSARRPPQRQVDDGDATGHRRVRRRTCARSLEPAEGRGHQGDVRARQRRRSPSPRTTSKRSITTRQHEVDRDRRRARSTATDLDTDTDVPRRARRRRAAS